MKMVRLLIVALIMLVNTNLAFADNEAFANNEAFSKKDKKTAAIIYQLYFFIEFTNNRNSIAQFCFLGEQGSVIGKVIQRTHYRRSTSNKLDLLVSHWASPDDIPVGRCHIIYSTETLPEQEDTYKVLSRESMTITGNKDLKDTGNIAAINFSGTAASFIFSRKQLRRASFEVNHQLIRASNVIP